MSEFLSMATKVIESASKSATEENVHLYENEAQTLALVAIAEQLGRIADLLNVYVNSDRIGE